MIGTSTQVCGLIKSLGQAIALENKS